LVKGWLFAGCFAGRREPYAWPVIGIMPIILGDMSVMRIESFTMLDGGLKQTVKLCEYLIEHCITELRPYWACFVGVKRGVHVLSIEANPKEWLLRKPRPDASIPHSATRTTERKRENTDENNHS
jgi:hypothetical protein